MRFLGHPVYSGVAVLPRGIVDITSLMSFKRSIKSVDFTKYLKVA